MLSRPEAWSCAPRPAGRAGEFSRDPALATSAPGGPPGPLPSLSMIGLLPLLLAAAGGSTLPPSPSPLAPLTVQDRQAEFERRFAEARDDVDALWRLHGWTQTYGLEREGREVLRRVVELQPDDRRARELLGHIRVDGRWFESQRKADRYLEEKAEREAKAKGWVRYGDRWVDPAEVPYLERGLVRADDGRWVTPEELEMLAGGWVRQDLTWVAPDERQQMEQGLWKIGDSWFSLEEANLKHSLIGAWWTLPGEHFEVWTTADRSHAELIRDELDTTFADLVRFFGVEPVGAPPVIVLRSVGQYAQLANGTDRLPAADLSGHATTHEAFLTDGLYDEEGNFFGTGASYWGNGTEADLLFGRHYSRHAAGLAFVEAIDPSPKFESKVQRNLKTLERGVDKFYEEKRIAPVLRWGAAAYVERFFADRRVADGGDVYWTRKWAWKNILDKGGLEPLASILDFELVLGDPSASTMTSNLIAQAGLLVAFILSGEVQPVSEAHQAWREALVAGDDLRRPTKALFSALLDSEEAFREFARGLGE